MKVAEYIIDRISKHVGHVFYVPGGGAMHLVEALGNHPSLQAVSMLHEQGAGYAAQAYGMYHGMGVCLVTSGPGATNAITGVAAAWMDSYPMLVVSGQVKTATLMKGLGVRSYGSQEVDIVSMVKPITKYAVTVMSADAVRDTLNTLIAEALNGRRGPVWLDVPLDIQGKEMTC